MCVICKNELNNIIEVDCQECKTITNIPFIEAMERLWCNNCILLSNLSAMRHFKRLKLYDCSLCHLITRIPLILG